ncbi:CAP domain-containing protein [Sphingomonas oligophenolica]
MCWLTLAGTSAPPPPPSDTLEDAVLAEINFVRTHPRDYADDLRRYRDLFDGRVVHLPGDPVGEMTNEGTDAVDEAIDFLDRQAPLPALEPGALLARAARGFADEQGASGYTGHRSADGEMPGDRVKRLGGGIFVGETISYGYDDPVAVVRQLIIDDGLPGRGHRALIFSPGSLYAGVGCGVHPRNRFLCVIDYSASPDGGPNLPKFVAARR